MKPSECYDDAPYPVCKFKPVENKKIERMACNYAETKRQLIDAVLLKSKPSGSMVKKNG